MAIAHIPQALQSDREALLGLLARRAFERRKVTLSSGRESDYYLDCRRVTLDPEGARLCGRLLYAAYKANIKEVGAVGGPTLGADPLVVSFMLCALEAGERLSGFLVRKEPKTHGAQRLIEGGFGLQQGTLVLLLEDVLTTGASLLRAAQAVRSEGFVPCAAIVLVDRCEGGEEALSHAGLPLYSLFMAQEVAEAHDRAKVLR